MFYTFIYVSTSVTRRKFSVWVLTLVTKIIGRGAWLMKVDFDLGIRRWFSRWYIYIYIYILRSSIHVILSFSLDVCLQINEVCIVYMCSSCDKVDGSLSLMLLSLLLLLLFSLHDQSIDWIISGFWRPMMIILFFSSSLTTTRSWLSYVLFASLSFSCRSSFFIFSFSLSFFIL